MIDLNRYFSDNSFNNKYQNKINKIESLKLNIIKDKFQNFSIYGEDSFNDFCIDYNRMMTAINIDGSLLNRFKNSSYCNKSSINLSDLKNISLIHIFQKFWNLKIIYLKLN